MPDLSTAIQAYVQDRKNKGMAPSTVRREAGVLKWFLAEVGNISTTSIQPRHVDAFWGGHAAGWAQNTKNATLASLSSFFIWLRRRGYLSRDTDPLEGMRQIKPPPRHRVIIPQSQFSTFLGDIKNARARAAAAIGLYLFTRISETGGLRWQDDRGTEMEVYRSKTKTIDILPICEELREELDRWKFAYAAEVGSPVKPGWFIVPQRTPSRFLKGSKPGKNRPLQHGLLVPTRKAALNDAIRRVLQDAGYYELNEGGHTLRRSGAIALYHRLTYMGHDRAMRVCQAMLGHANIRTTEIYLMLDLDRKLRNDLLSGQPMFPDTVEADVVDLRRIARGGEDHQSLGV
jgi:integrase